MHPSQWDNPDNSVFCALTVYLLKLLWISATWEESLSIPKLILRNQVQICRYADSHRSRKTTLQRSVISTFCLITWLHNRTIEAHQMCLDSPFPVGPQNKVHTCERPSCQELAHVAQMIPQWTGEWAWCHPLPRAASLTPYKDLHHMVLMAFSLLAQVGCFSTGWSHEVKSGAMCGGASLFACV